MHRKVWKAPVRKAEQKPFLDFCLCVCVFSFAFHRVLFSHFIYEHEILMCSTIYLTRKQYNNSNRLKSFWCISNIQCCCSVEYFCFILFYFVSSNQIVFLFVWIVSIYLNSISIAFIQEWEINCENIPWRYPVTDRFEFLFHLL